MLTSDPKNNNNIHSLNIRLFTSRYIYHNTHYDILTYTYGNDDEEDGCDELFGRFPRFPQRDYTKHIIILLYTTPLQTGGVL